MDTLNITIERDSNDTGFRVAAASNNGNYWGVGIIFPTLEGARSVATAIANASDAPRVGITVQV